jgi:arginyl-tRNA synthetase
VTTFSEYRRTLLEALVRLAPGEEARRREAELLQALAFTRPPKPELGDLALAAFPVAKSAGRPPAEVARDWAERVRAEASRPESPLAALEIPLVRVEPQGPYLNLFLEPAALAAFVLRAVTEEGERYGRAPAATGQTVMVEYSSPNTNKPLHLGHVRNNVLGMSIANLLEATGDRVVRVNLVNDRGIHICKSMLAYSKWGGGETPEGTGEKGDHLVGRYYVLFTTRLNEERAEYARGRGVDLARFSKESLRARREKEEQKLLEAEAERFEEEFTASSALMAEVQEWLRRWEADDPEILRLWRTMNGWVYEGFRTTYERLGCRFDKWYFESETWQLGKQEVERGLREGIFYRQPDGSVWARLTSEGLQDKIVLRADGTSVYITQDIGTALRKFDDYPMDRSIYVVGSEQVSHFQNLFALFRLLGYSWASRCHHASYGLINLPHGMGRLKSREGISVDADDLLDELHRVAREKIQDGGYCETPEQAEETAEQIGLGALKLYILQVSAEKNIQFDPAESIAFTGDTGPAVQYSHARIHGILRRGVAEGKVGADEIEGGFLRSGAYDPALLTEPEERDVLRQILEFPDMVALASRQLSPAPAATALLGLTKAYARMYHQHEVLRAEPALLRTRLQLSLCVAQVLRNGLGLLGIAAPERM